MLRAKIEIRDPREFQTANSESGGISFRNAAPRAGATLRRNHVCERSAAFTLIELILAIGVVAIVMIAINAAFFTSMRLRDATYRTVEEAIPVQQALATMRRDLQGVLPPSEQRLIAGDFKAGGVTSLGSGAPVEIEFCTTTGIMHDEEPWSEVQRITYGLRQSSDRSLPGQDLVRGVSRNLLATIPAQPEEEWMMSGVESIEFACYDGLQWRTMWDTEVTDTNLPSAVRVRILLANTNRTGGGEEPIEMIVPIDVQSLTNSTTSTEESSEY